jgi:polar amino acid transport system substrate-binding protein
MGSEQCQIVYTILEQPKYIAFSRQVDDLTVQRWQMALDEIKKDGTFENILHAWMMGFGS